MNADNWINHLQHPLVLAGFGLFIFAVVVRPLFLNNSKLSGTATERVLHKGMILLFILAAMAMLSGFMLSWKATPAANNNGSDLTMTKAQFTAMLKQQEKTIKTMLASVNGDEKERHLLEQKLKSIQKKQADVQYSYELALKNSNATKPLTAEIQEQLPTVQVPQTGKGLHQDGTKIERRNEEEEEVSSVVTIQPTSQYFDSQDEDSGSYPQNGRDIIGRSERLPSVISSSEYSFGENYSERIVTLSNTLSLTVDDIQILHDIKVRVQFPDEFKAQVVPADIAPTKLLEAELLDFSNSPLYKIPPWLKRFTNLRRLNLSKNHLDADSDLLETLQAMPKLDVLNLSDNPLFAKEPASSQSLAPVWQRLTELGELYLSETGGTAKNFGSLAPLWSLQKLDLSNNRIKNKVGVLELNKLTGLQELHLSHNGISRFPGTELPVQSLQLLDLSNNDLTEIPYVAMNALQIWNLQGNGSVRLADDYGDMFSVKSIKKLQYDSGSDYDNLSNLPKGLQKKLTRLAKKEKERLRKQRELDCSTGGVKIDQYIDHCDGTITDTSTGLMWKRCSEGLSGINCERGKLKKYEWDDTVKRFKDVQYAGYADWRLPSIDELKTLVYCSNGVKNKDNGECNDSSAKPTINHQAFPNTPSSSMWSGSPRANRSTTWSIYFNDGSSNAVFRSYNLVVRLVRDGQ